MYCKYNVMEHTSMSLNIDFPIKQLKILLKQIHFPIVQINFTTFKDKVFNIF